jgi:uncharacterized protein (DUF58 family)
VIVLPSRRWLVGAGLLALAAPLALVAPAGATVILVLDLVWLAALLLDAARATSPRSLAIAREAPVAFGVGRTTIVRYRWRPPGTGALVLIVRERLPDPLGGAVTPERVLRVPPGEGLEEQLELTPTHRG